MFCTNCGGQIRFIEESNGKTDLKDRYYGYCEICKIKVKIPEEEIYEANINGHLQKMEEMVSKGADKLNSLMEKAKDAGINWWKNKQRLAEIEEMCQMDSAIPLNIQFGYEQLGIEQVTIMRQMLDGRVYFGYERDKCYRLVSYRWEGSEFQTVSDNTQKEQTKYREKNRMGGRGLATGVGAVIGTAILPGVGTIVGATVGAAGPRKGKTKGRSVETLSSSQVVDQVEKDTLAYLTIQSIETEVEYKIMLVCNRKLDGMISCLKWDVDQVQGGN